MEKAPGHPHQETGPTTLWRLAFSAAIFGLNFLVQGLAGMWTGSLGLVSDSLENLNDFVVNLLAIGAISLANKREPCDRYAYGWHRLEVFHTLLGVGLLGALAAGILWEAWHRLHHPVPIQIGWTIAFSALGMLLNLAATFVLLPPKGTRLAKDLNLRSAYLHALGDSLANVAVISAMVAIRYTGWRWIDPIVAVLIVLVILRGAFLLLRSAAAILMHRAAFDHEAAKTDLLKLPGVLGIEDLRSWKICSHLTVATAHVLVDAERLDETERYLKDIEHVLSEHYSVRHLTVHFETSTMASRHHHKFLHQHEADGQDPVHHGEHNHRH
ncbi:MAG: cation transporter [Holophagaceae bacterium]|nr:cation transporter [Holophagaceae bacterium]